MMKSINVEPSVIKTDFTIEYETPEFGIATSCREAYGINSEEEYEQWKTEMAKNWKYKNK